MRKFDFVLQVLGFTMIGFLMLVALFVEEGIALLFYGMFFLGLYHLCHFCIYLIYALATEKEGQEFMTWYPVMVIGYFIFGRLTMQFVYFEGYALLMAAIAILIGGYYFQGLHGGELKFRVELEKDDFV